MSDTYETIRTGVRPPRVACFIRNDDPDWQATAMIALESFSSVWGGGGFILIPTDGKTIDPVFWEILFSFDADYFWTAYKTTSDSEVSVEFTAELGDELVLRLAPFHYSSDEQLDPSQKQNLWLRRVTHPDFSAHYPFTDVATIIGNTRRPPVIHNVVDDDPWVALWMASCLGLASKTSKTKLSASGIRVESLTLSDSGEFIFKNVVNGPYQLSRGEDARFPMSLSLAELGLYTSLEFSHWNESTLIVLGNRIEDFCLYVSLSRMRRKVVWLLSKWLPEDLSGEIPGHRYDPSSLARFSRNVYDLAHANQSQGLCSLLSHSLPPSDLELRRGQIQSWASLEIRADLPGIEAGDSDNYSLADSVRYLLRYPSRLFESGNAERISSKHFLGNRMAGLFDVPRPKNFDRVDPSHHHWITDFSIAKRHFPRRPTLGKEILREPLFFSTHARVGRETIAFVDPRSGLINDDFDSWIRRPEVILPDAFEIFRLLLAPHGFKIQKSDKGRFANRTIEKFGSLGTFSNFILGDAKRKLFDAFLDHGDSEHGVFLQFDRRRYLDVQAIEQIFGAPISAFTAIIYLMSIDVLYRGLIFKCNECLAMIWYDIREVSTNYDCKRCGTPQPYRGAFGIKSIEPSWYYKLDEVVFQTFAQRCDIPILATHALSTGTKSFDYSPEIEILDGTSAKPIYEIDICCIADGRLTIGEAKAANKLGDSKKAEDKSLQKYFDLANKIGAEQVVFATDSETWRDETKAKILAKFKGSRTQTVIWGRSDVQQRKS